MFIINRLIGFGGSSGGSGGTSLLDLISQAGLLSNLQLCNDVGSSSSYPGSGQTWSDLSGNGVDFYLGADGSVTATDPTYTGVGDAAYWLHDGGDYHRLVAASNPSWVDAFHKDNAVGTILVCHRTPSSLTGNFDLCGTDNIDGGNIGFALESFGGALRFHVYNGSGYVLDVTAGSTLSTSAGHMTAVAWNEATGAAGGFFWDNGAYVQVSASDTWTSTYSSPSASNSPNKLELGAGGAGDRPLANTWRTYAYAMWSTKLSKANLDSLYSAAQAAGRFGV